MRYPIIIREVPAEIAAVMQSSHRYAPTLHAHSLRTANLAALVARELLLGASDSALLVTAAYLHDFGKLFIPPDVLEKCGELSEPEISLIRAHPRIGETCLACLPRMQRVATIVGQHHERLDGAGYPDGRNGSSIDPLARMLSPIDAFIAMTEDRPYARARKDGEALAELRYGAGRQFDMIAVDAIHRVYARGAREVAAIL